ncbi:MAG: hypothetical protein WBE44_17055 [Terriglobales bacterium]|jgi:hypothetical protein
MNKSTEDLLNKSILFMTKAQVLDIFSQSGNFLRPDDVYVLLRTFPHRRSLYSYLGRLQRQGLLERHPNSRRGNLAYRLTPRGEARLEYLRRSGKG